MASHHFSQIRRRSPKSNFKPGSIFIENAIQEYKIRGGVIKEIEFCMDEKHGDK